MRALIDSLLAIPCALLPKRYWQSFDLPMANMAPVSAWVTMIGGFAIGIPGYFAFLERLRQSSGASILAISFGFSVGAASAAIMAPAHQSESPHD